MSGEPAAVDRMRRIRRSLFFRRSEVACPPEVAVSPATGPLLRISGISGFIRLRSLPSTRYGPQAKCRQPRLVRSTR